jgi:hypothetical protein
MELVALWRHVGSGHAAHNKGHWDWPRGGVAVGQGTRLANKKRLAALRRSSGPGHKAYNKEARRCDWPRFGVTFDHGPRPGTKNIGSAIGRAFASKWVGAQGPQQRKAALRVVALWRRSWPEHRAHNQEKWQCDWPRFGITGAHGTRPKQRIVATRVVAVWRRSGSGHKPNCEQRGNANGRTLAVQWARAQRTGPKQRQLATRRPAQWVRAQGPKRETVSRDLPRVGVTVAQGTRPK